MNGVGGGEPCGQEARVRGPISECSSWMLPATAVASGQLCKLNHQAVAFLHHAVAAFARASAVGQRSLNAVANRVRQEGVEEGQKKCIKCLDTYPVLPKLVDLVDVHELEKLLLAFFYTLLPNSVGYCICAAVPYS